MAIIKKKYDTNINIRFYDYENKNLYIRVNIENIENVLDKILINPTVQNFWNEIKEKFKGEVDEQKLYDIFKFYLFVLIANYALEKTTEITRLPNLLNSEYGYIFYKDSGGKLSKKEFKELIKKIFEHHKEMFIKEIF